MQIPMTLMTLTLLATAAFGGALEDAFKNPPADAAPAADTGAKCRAKCAARRQALLAAGEAKDDAPALSISGTDAAVKHVCRAFKDGTIGYLIDCPADLESANLRLTFAVANANPELWDPATGAILRPGKVETRGSRTVVTWRADPEASVFVMLRPSRSTAKKAKLYDDSKIQEISVGGSWDPVLSGTDGTFTLKNALVHMSDYPAAVWLDLGKAKGVFEVKVNGKALPPLWKPPYRLDIVEALSFTEDRHTIEPGADVGEQAKLELVLKATGTFGPVKFSAASN